MLKSSIKVPNLLLCSIVIIIVSLSAFIIATEHRVSVINQALASEISQSDYSHIAATDGSVKDLENIINCDCEKTFSGEEEVLVSGRVIAMFVSGTDLGIKNLDPKAEYQHFYVDAGGKYQGDIDGLVKIKGRLIGVTCAYANSVFHECVPEIEAQTVESLR